MRRAFSVRHWLSAWLIACGLLVSGLAAAAELPDFTELVKKSSPAVVNISTTQKVERSRPELPPGLEIPKEGPWQDFFRHFFGNPEEGGPRQREARSLGSGVVISEDGYILTNGHVVEEADEIVVRFRDRKEFQAELIGVDPRSDVALIKVDAEGLPTAKIGDMSGVEVGQWVAAIGSPFGFDQSVSVGVVSALGRSLPSETYVPFIQSDVAINPGNSGGPLFNLDGEVIGINSQIFSRTGGYMGLSFAIPVDVAMNVVEQLKEKGYVSRGWLGVLIQDVTRDLAESFGMKKPAGALVAKVVPDSPAEDSGLQVGDVIIRFNGERVHSSSDLPPLVGQTGVGSDANVEIIREGNRKDLEVTIGELPEEDEMKHAQRSPKQPESGRKLGLVVESLSKEEKSELELENGVRVQEVQPGPARSAGVRPGDVIVKLNNEDVTGVEQFERTVKELPRGKSVPMLIQRGSGPMFLALRLPEKEE